MNKGEDLGKAINIIGSIMSLESDRSGELYADEKWLFNFLIELQKEHEHWESYGKLSRDDIRCSIWPENMEIAKELEITDEEFRKIVRDFGEAIWWLDLWGDLKTVAMRVLGEKVKKIDPTI